MSSSSQIAKNTIFLYIRLGVSMIVSLYTSRVVLNALGVEDFGVLGVVGGLVSMFLFLNSALSASTSRFLTYAIGENNVKKLNQYFSASILIHIALSVMILITCETIGLWFLKNKLVIPESKTNIANVVFHLSIITAIIPIITVPFNSLIIAYERMNIFAYLSISDTIFKLIIAWAIQLFTENRLGYYSLMLLGVSMINAAFYIFYCKHEFKHIKYSFVANKELYVSLASFSSWSLFGNIAYVGYTQGLNMLLNMFFGPVVNAARTISLQIEQTIRSFIGNFQTAINPQIIKSYAQHDFSQMHSLMFRSSKFSVFLFLFFAIPIAFETDTLLVLWLKQVPEHTINFCRLMFIVIAFETMTNSIGIGVVATGNIKRYHVIVGTILMLIVPTSYIALRLGAQPESVFIVYLFYEIIAVVVRLLIARTQIRLPFVAFLNKVLFKCVYVTIISAIIPCIIHFLIDNTLFRFILVGISSIISNTIVIYCLGLEANERNFVIALIRKFICK